MLCCAGKKIEDRGCRIAPRTPRRPCIPGAPAILYLLSSILFPAALPGCVPVGAVVNKVVGEPPIPPRYVPNSNRPMLVLVENYRNPDANRLDAQRATMYLAEELRSYRIAPVVDAEVAEALRSRPEYRSMKVEEVGRAAGAGQVLYVNLQQVKVDNTVGGDMLKARAQLSVRVVDAETGRTLWPTETAQGEALVADSPWVRTPAGAAEGTSEPALRDQLARTAAHQIVRMFRKWRPEDEEQELEETVR